MCDAKSVEMGAPKGVYVVGLVCGIRIECAAKSVGYGWICVCMQRRVVPGLCVRACAFVRMCVCVCVAVYLTCCCQICL
jgi:hypothetical protein